MPNITVTNLTRNAVSLPGVPPFTLQGRQENGASMVDTILAPFQSRTINVPMNDLAGIQTILQPQLTAGVLRIMTVPPAQGVSPSLQEVSRVNMMGHDSIPLPIAGGTSLSGGAVSSALNISTGSGLTQLDVPRNVQVVFGATWNGGFVTVVGTLVDGSTKQEVFSFPVGGGTVIGSAGFVVVAAAFSTGTYTTGTINVQNGGKLALARKDLAAVLKESVYVPGSGTPTNEAIGTVDLKSGTVIPTTAADGTHSYEFWYL